MGYKGYEEFLCEKGHFTTYDRNDFPYSDICARCGARLTHQHSVDQTNGFSAEHAATCPAPKMEFGFEDEWHIDHYGNRYAVKIPLYKPQPGAWSNIATLRLAAEERQRLNAENKRWSIQLLDEQGGLWQILNEFDAENPQVFKFLNHAESDDVSLVHAFTSQEAAETALQAIVGELKRVADATGGFMPFAQVFWFDLRTY